MRHPVQAPSTDHRSGTRRRPQPPQGVVGLLDWPCLTLARRARGTRRGALSGPRARRYACIRVVRGFCPSSHLFPGQYSGARRGSAGGGEDRSTRGVGWSLQDAGHIPPEQVRALLGHAQAAGVKRNGLYLSALLLHPRALPLPPDPRLVLEIPGALRNRYGSKVVPGWQPKRGPIGEQRVGLREMGPARGRFNSGAYTLLYGPATSTKLNARSCSGLMAAALPRPLVRRQRDLRPMGW
jgi:hypothetical protein